MIEKLASSEKLQSRKFWAGTFTAGSLLVSAWFGLDIQPEIVDALTYIALVAFGGIGLEDAVKALASIIRKK